MSKSLSEMDGNDRQNVLNAINAFCIASTELDVVLTQEISGSAHYPFQASFDDLQKSILKWGADMRSRLNDSIPSKPATLSEFILTRKPMSCFEASDHLDSLNNNTDLDEDSIIRVFFYAGDLFITETDPNLVRDTMPRFQFVTAEKVYDADVIIDLEAILWDEYRNPTE